MIFTDYLKRVGTSVSVKVTTRVNFLKLKVFVLIDVLLRFVKLVHFLRNFTFPTTLSSDFGSQTEYLLVCFVQVACFRINVRSVVMCKFDLFRIHIIAKSKRT